MIQSSMPSPTKLKDASTGLAPLSVIRTETVLSRLPIHNLSKKGSVRIRITKKNENGETDLHWLVSPNPEYGDPRQLAYKLDTIVINQKLDEIGRLGPAHMTQDIYGKKFFPTPLNQCRGLSKT